METKISASSKFMKIYNSLPNDSDQRQEINEALDLLKEDCERGDKIQRDRRPKCYIEAFDIKNLYRFKLREGKRIIYTNYSVSKVTFCNVLEIFTSHKEYEKRFDY